MPDLFDCPSDVNLKEPETVATKPDHSPLSRDLEPRKPRTVLVASQPSGKYYRPVFISSYRGVESYLGTVTFSIGMPEPKFTFKPVNYNPNLSLEELKSLVEQMEEVEQM